MGYTVIHATHEAVRKMGGIGTVLQGLIASPVYQDAVSRTLLVGPITRPDEADMLAREGAVRYSSLDRSLQRGTEFEALRQVEWQHNVNLIYGRRSFGQSADADVLLVDATDANPRPLRNFKHRLYQSFGLRSDRYEDNPDFLLYLNIAAAAYDALEGLLDGSDGPHIVLAHEYMGMPLALQTVLARNPRFRAIFYAHEVSTMRGIVETSPGHDTMFYNAMRRARAEGISVGDVFGDWSHYHRHALVSLAPHCDGIFAVGDPTLDELRFLGADFRDYPIDLVYNGIPAVAISARDREHSRNRLLAYANSLLGYRPNAVFTHVTRPVVSKGLWRDLGVLRHLDNLLDAQNRTGVFFVLTTAVGARNPEDVRRMEIEYGWPADHRLGAPDLIGSEAGIWSDMAAFNAQAKAVRCVLVNQFGWNRASCGQLMPEDMAFMDLRKGSDLEFGQSIYEPFGIAVFEPLSFGAVCVPSSVSGCCGFLEKVTGGHPVKNVVVADYTSLEGPRDLDSVLKIGFPERDQIEAEQAERLAWAIMGCLPQNEAEREDLLQSGYALASEMSWDRVCREFFLPGLARAVARRR